MKLKNRLNPDTVEKGIAFTKTLYPGAKIDVTIGSEEVKETVPPGKQWIVNVSVSVVEYNELTSPYPVD